MTASRWLNAVGVMVWMGCGSATSGPTGPAGAQGPSGAAGATGSTGEAGANGVNGADGNLSHTYGDGSAQAPVFAAGTTDWTSAAPANHDYQFTDFTVPAGATLIVESGTLIRCTGTFTNNGTIVVAQGTTGGSVSADTEFNATTPAEAGEAFRLAQNGEVSLTGASPNGGPGGMAVSAGRVPFLLQPSAKAGGAGGGTRWPGALGGGSLVVRAQHAITLGAGSLVSADGLGNPSDNGAGGGAGGIIILATSGTLTVNGTVRARGGDGGTSANNFVQGDAFGAGGGGGGGIVHLLSPSQAIASSSLIVVDGGARGATIGSAPSHTPHIAGGGGGACGGDGGHGGNIVANVSFADAQAGSAGVSLQTNLDPIDFFSSARR